MKYQVVWLVCLGVMAFSLSYAGVGREIKPIQILQESSTINALAFSPDGRYLAAGTCGKTVDVFDVSTEKKVYALVGHKPNYDGVFIVETVTFSPDGQILASGSVDHTIKLWDMRTGKLLHTLIGHHGYIGLVAFLPEGRTLVSGSGNENAIKLWDVETGDCTRTILHHYCKAISANGKTFASAGGGIDLYDMGTARYLRTLTGHKSDVWSVAFSPDGKTLAAGFEDNTIKLWDVGTGECTRTVSGHTGEAYYYGADRVYSVAFSPDGKILASGSGDSTIKLWNVSTGELIRTLTGHTSDVRSLAFSPDGKSLASGSVTGSLFLWDIDAILHPNITPEARFVFSPVSPENGTYVQFNASTSADPDGTISSYRWSFGDGSVAYNTRPIHSFSRAGTFTVTLTVTDDDGATASVSKTITVKEANRSPSASFTWQALSPSGTRLVVEPRTGDRLKFDASSSSDSDGKIVQYSWDWDSDGSYDASSKDPVIGHMFTTPGSHKVTLQVTDDKGGTATVSKTLTIGEKQPPHASFNYTPISPTVLDTMHFTDGSSDPDGEIKKWLWSFGDGTTSTEQDPTNQYTQKKTYTVTLKVTDDDGLTDTATKQVTVINLHPEATFSFTPNQPYVQQPVAFDASSSADKDGTIKGYSWDFGDESVANGKTTSHTFTEEGTYTVVVTVTDNDGATAFHQEKITVEATPPGPPKFNDEWGLVVGIADYEDPSVRDLDFTENDAQAFYNFLVDRNAGGFSKDHVRLLLGKDATLIGMRKGLDWLSNAAGPDDLVVFYYAGHGATVPDKNHDEAKVNPGDNLDECLVPYNADSSSLAATTLVDDAIGYWFSNLSSQHVLMVFDSCFSGGASREARSFGKGGARAAAGNEVFTDMAGAGRLFLAASRADQSSFENGTLQHGVFTYFLLRGLGDKDLPEVSGLPPIARAEADKDGDGRVTVEEMKEYLDEKIPPFVRKHEDGGEQTPVLSGDEGLRDIRLNGYGVPLIGEVTAIQGGTVIISLGSRQGIQPGDQFEVIRPLTLPDGTVMNEMEATIEVLYILGPDRAGCKIVKSLFPIMVKDQVRRAPNP